MRTPRMAAHCRFIITPPLLSPPWFDDDDEARGVYYALSFKSIHFSGKVIRLSCSAPRACTIGCRSSHEAAQHLERHPDAAVQDAAVERRPGIDGPSAVDRPDRPEHRAPVGLANIAKVFGIHEHPKLSDPLLDQSSKQHVGSALTEIGIVVEALAPGQIAFDANPSGHDSRAATSQSHLRGAGV